MPQNYDPNLGVYSAFAGVGNALSDVGKMGMVDAMETRRSKMEHDLRRQLKGEDQDFAAGQADIADTRKVDAATTKSGRDIEAAKVKLAGDKELERIKNKGRAGSASNKLANKEMLAPDGKTPVALETVRKLFADSNGLNQDLIDWDKVEPDFNVWTKNQGYSWRMTGPVPPPKRVPQTEAVIRQRAIEMAPTATEDEIDKYVEQMRGEGLITAGEDTGVLNEVVGDVTAQPGAAPAPVAPAQTTETDNGIVPSSGILDTAKSGVLAAQQMLSGENIGPEKKPVQPWKENRRETALKNEQQSLMKYKSEAPKANRRGKTAAVDKAVKQASAAIKKGNIKMVSKDNLRMALNKRSFVDGLTKEDVQVIKEYLNSK